MTDQPNLSREVFQKLEFVGREGNDLIYTGPGDKLVVLDVQSVTRLGKPLGLRSRRKNRQSDDDVWSGFKNNQREQDKKATIKLIEILKSYHKQGELFTTRRMRKKEVWVDIASRLMAEGFHFSNKETAWEKVSQKWRNMERTYRLHIQQFVNKGGKVEGTEALRSLEFFDDLHELLSDKYNTKSVLVGERNSPDSSYEADDSCQYILINRQMECEEEEEREHETVTAELGPELEQPEQRYDNYVDTASPPSPTFSDNKSLFLPSDPPHPDNIQDPVLRLLVEMRAQEKAHHREDRRERLKIQKETLDFQRNLIDMLNQHHQERMEMMHTLILAITSTTQPDLLKDRLTPINGDRS